MNSPTINEQLFERAREAAENKQPDVMIENLFLSKFIDGLVRRLSSKWYALPQFEIVECVAVAVDSAYEAISGGRRITNLGGWLWKVAHKKAHDRWVDDYQSRQSGTDVEGLRAGEHLSESERAKHDAQQELVRREAIRLARSLLPKIGGGQIASVMEIVIDAVEQNVPDLSAADIGDALEISHDAARSLLSRGFNRLEREARREGIEFPEVLVDNDYGDE